MILSSLHFGYQGEVFTIDIPGGLVFCVFDSEKSLGGLVHFSDFKNSSKQTESGEDRIKNLLKEFKAADCEPSTLKVTLLASGHNSPEKRRDIKDNLRSARLMAGAFGLSINKECIAGTGQLRVRMNTATGQVEFQLRGCSESVKPTLTKRIKTKKTITVLIVDDSVMIQKLLSSVFQQHPDFEIFGVATHPLEAEKLMQTERPDVVTLDMNMPHMDGLTYLADYLVPKQIPVIMISGVCTEDGVQAMRSLELGAVDFIAKPSSENLSEFADELTEKVLAASHAILSNISELSKKSGHTPAAPARAALHYKAQRLIAIGSSTGGTQALANLFGQLPAEIPPILVVQHIPEHFSKMFADRLNSYLPFAVKEAAEGDEVVPNQVLIAPGGKQMKITDKAGKLVIAITDDDPINRHKPSVDYLFNSAAQHCGNSTVAVMLTGMGKDGAAGFQKLEQLGAKVIAQDELSSVVYGMPKEAARLAPSCEILGLNAIGQRMLEHCAASRAKATKSKAS